MHKYLVTNWNFIFYFKNDELSKGKTKKKKMPNSLKEKPLARHK